MSSPEFIQARTIIQAAIADLSNPQFVDQCLNEAQREVARARKWPELMSRAFFNTEPAYSTGTIAVTDGGTTVTLTGGTWPTNAVGMRFALSVSSPWYTIRTRTSGAAVELAQPYRQDAETAAHFIVYKSHYSMPSTLDRIEQVWIHDTAATELTNVATDQQLSQFAHYPSGPGVPMRFLSIERDASGNRQIVVGPETPNDVYRVEYTYRRKVVDNQFSGNLDDSRWPVIVSRAKSLAYEGEFFDRSIVEMKRYESLLAAEWTSENEVETSSVRVGQNRLDYPLHDPTEDVWSRGTIGPTV